MGAGVRRGAAGRPPAARARARRAAGAERPDEVLAAYRRKGLAARVGFGRRPAVVVVDFILGFTDRRSPLVADLDRELQATKRLLDAARRAGAPVVFTTVAYDPSLRDAGVFLKKVPSLAWLKAGTRWVELDPRLKRRAGELVVNKQYASAFFGTSLASTLRAQGVDTVIVCGATTSGCVRATVVDALQHGFRAIVPRECVADRAAGPHEANLVDIDGKYGDVVTLADVLKRLRK
jgi:nicotinamidase-related amidase